MTIKTMLIAVIMTMTWVMEMTMIKALSVKLTISNFPDCWRNPYGNSHVVLIKTLGKCMCVLAIFSVLKCNRLTVSILTV